MKTPTTHHTFRTRRTRLIGTAIAMSGLLLGTAACGDEKAPEDAAAPTASANAKTYNAAASSPRTGNGAHGAQDCPIDSNAPEITENISKLPHNPYGWKLTNQTNYNPCADLSYALITQARQGNAQFATQLMLFHKGKYIGIASDTIQQTEILRTTPNSVKVRMRDWEALRESGEANVMAGKYFSDVTFRWDGSKVVPEGRIPNQNLPKEIGGH